MDSTKKRRIVFYSAIVFAILFSIVWLISSSIIEKKHFEEIRNKIKSLGGEIIQIEDVGYEESPFESSRGANTIYKITYAKDGVRRVAWYRAINNPVNIHQPSSKTKGEKWVIESK